MGLLGQIGQVQMAKINDVSGTGAMESEQNGGGKKSDGYQEPGMNHRPNATP